MYAARRKGIRSRRRQARLSHRGPRCGGYLGVCGAKIACRDARYFHGRAPLNARPSS